MPGRSRASTQQATCPRSGRRTRPPSACVGWGLADLFNRRGRDWLARQPVPDDERQAIERHVRELDRLGEDLAVLDREVAQSALDDPAIKRLITITGVNLTVAAGLMAAIGDIGRFKSPQKLVS